MENRIHNMNEETVVNESGGAQSKIHYTPTLVPGEALRALRRTFINTNNEWKTRSIESLIDETVEILEILLDSSENKYLEQAFGLCARAITVEESKAVSRSSTVPSEPALRIAEVTAFGKEKYGLNNWRLIPYTDHLDHAITHLWQWQAGDTSDDHLGHALTRLSFSIAMLPEKDWNFKAIVVPKRTPTEQKMAKTEQKPQIEEQRSLDQEIV